MPSRYAPTFWPITTIIGWVISISAKGSPSIIELAAFLPSHPQDPRWVYELYQSSAPGSIQMAQHFVSDATTDENVSDAKVASLISDFDRIVGLLDCEILAEEKRTLVFDPQDAAYSMLARALRTRRDNLKATIATLERKAGATVVRSAA
jgi:hypothetical protein